MIGASGTLAVLCTPPHNDVLDSASPLMETTDAKRVGVRCCGQGAHRGVVRCGGACGESSQKGSHMLKSAHFVRVLVLGLTLGGCATIISGSSQIMTVNANVDGAQVHLITEAGGETLLGTTPLTTRVKRGQEGSLRVSAEGYRSYQSALNKKINNVFWVNILLGGTFGSTTDYTTGAMYEYEPSTFMVSLQPAEQSTEEMNDWQRREALRGFVLHNSQVLVSDLAAGDGEYIDVLVYVLAAEPENRAEAIERWRAGYAASETAAEFAEMMVAELGH